MKPNNKKILLTLIFFALVPLACTLFVGGPEYPANPIPVSTEALGNLENQLQAAQTAAAQSGVLSLNIDETQLTSLLAIKLDAQTGFALDDPQVYLRDNQVQVYGKAVQGNLSANVRIILNTSIDPQGQPVISVTSADFGPFPAPEGLNSNISKIIDQAFTGAFGPAAMGIRLESISIQNGILTLTGRVK
jgi:hypothetical protein